MGSETQDTSSLSEITDPFHGLSFQVGVAENKNPTYRAKMEDVHTYVANFAEKPDWGYFAIFDGHAGKQTARWCGNNLHTLLEEEMLAMEASSSPSSLSSAPSTKSFSSTNSQPSEDNKDVRDALNRVFVKADELIEQEGSGSSGCTAAVAVLRWEGNSKETEEATIKGSSASKPFDFVPSENHKRMLYTANVGDSRIVLCRGNRSYRLTYDHKASDAKEISRIREAGGLVVKNRVNGVLAITRSLGDSYVKNLVTGRPFTTATEITKEDEFLILACDGVWDVITDDLACKFVQDIFRAQREKKQQEDPGYAAKKLCQYAIEKATTDNVTVMVVKLDPQVFPQRDN